MTPPVTDRDITLTRWVAVIAGLVGFLLSVATPCCRWCRPPPR